MPLPANENRKRKKAGAPSSFTEEQQACIAGYIDEFEQLLRHHDPNYDTSKKAVGDWKKSTVATILEHDSFACEFESDDDDNEENKKKCAAVSHFYIEGHLLFSLFF